MSNYYEILKVPRTATKEDIDNSFKRLSIKHHLGKNLTIADKYAYLKIAEAYEVLSDEKWKAAYDNFGPDALKNGVTDSTEDRKIYYRFKGNVDEICDKFFGYYSPVSDSIESKK